MARNFPSRRYGAFFAPALLSVSLVSAEAITQVTLRNAGAAKSQAFATFGMVFKPGDVPAGRSVAVAGAEAYQVEAKAAHADGSLRHAIISVDAGSMGADASKALSLSEAPAAAAGAPIPVEDVLKTAFDAAVSLTLGGTVYTAAARDGLASAKTWLAGPVCTEWIVYAPLKTPAGAAHPHLHARFAVRAYKGLKSIRADVIVENDWSYEPNPSGFTYDAKITVAGEQVYAKTGLGHSHHARWRKVFWWGGDGNLGWQYDRAYLLATGAFPNFDPSVKVSAEAVAGLKTAYEPMRNGDLTVYMPEAGAHTDIGPLPSFAAIWLMTQDLRAQANVLANGECGGSYRIHYRNKTTGNLLTIDEYPYVTIDGNVGDTHNPATDKLEAFPVVTGGLDTLVPDDAHQPSIGFVPYLISGDHFQLEELQFWANWNMILGNPYYRKYATGLIKWAQVRGQAWSMRTLGHAAYLTPDAHPLKKYFNEKLANNLEYYLNRYVKSPTANTIGHLDEQFGYEPYGIAPWMDDFFTWSMGYLVQLGFKDALPLAVFKSKFVVGRMSEPYCWLHASAYSLQMGTPDKTPYTTWAQIAQANYPNDACAGAKMDGYPDGSMGYGANMQPALAAAVDVAAPGAKAAWEKYGTRNPKQDYSLLPQFAVVPRDPAGAAIRPRPARRLGRYQDPAWFTPGASLAFDLPRECGPRMEIFDPAGRLVLDLDLGRLPAGRHEVDPVRRGRGLDWGAGPYLARLKLPEAAP